MGTVCLCLWYGMEGGTIVKKMRRGTQILRKIGSHKNWLKLATIKMVLSMVWSLTSNSLRLHCKTKIHSPLTVTSAVIVPRLTVEGQKGKGGPSAHPSKANKGPGWWKGTFALFGCWCVCWGEGKLLSKGWPPSLDNQWTRAFYRQRGLQSAL